MAEFRWRNLPFFFVVRHFMMAADPTAKGAASDRYAPFYGDKIGRCMLSEEYQLDERGLTCHMMGQRLFLGQMRLGLLLSSTDVTASWALGHIGVPACLRDAKLARTGQMLGSKVGNRHPVAIV